MEIKQYQIFLANLDPTQGSEIKKTRPCLIVSPDEMNRNLQTVVICPLTTNLNQYPTRVVIKTNEKKGMIIVDQIRTIDKSRIIKPFGTLLNIEIKNIKKVIKETFVD